MNGFLEQVIIQFDAENDVAVRVDVAVERSLDETVEVGDIIRIKNLTVGGAQYKLTIERTA